MCRLPISSGSLAMHHVKATRLCEPGAANDGAPVCAFRTVNDPSIIAMS
jgi:hypothetical protein